MLLHYFSFATNEPSGLMILVMSFWISTFIDLIAALVFHLLLSGKTQKAIKILPEAQ